MLYATAAWVSHYRDVAYSEHPCGVCQVGGCIPGGGFYGNWRLVTDRGWDMGLRMGSTLVVLGKGTFSASFEGLWSALCDEHSLMPSPHTHS